VHVGFDNRLLGENMCHAVFDGGPLEQRRAYFTRAEAAFTEALAIAGAIGHDSITRAARAGRAATRVWLGDWSGAVADAALVPPGFKYVLSNSAVEQELYNRIYWSSANQPFRNTTVWNTFYETYHPSTGDPRVAWVRHPTVSTMSTGRPWLIQNKYRTREAGIALASEREMRLIVAEERLRAGDWSGALAILNGLRAEIGVTAWSASNATETWTALKRERGVELWLEARRLGDLDRWLADGSPGVADDMTDRDTCFPIGQTEMETNANLAGMAP
jgi:starch-binding outer membrane protein, SusD/RagB family